MHAHKPSVTRVDIDKNVWKELHPNGETKWFALEPGTGKTIEIDREDTYFYTEAWQAKEREADEDIAAGRTEKFDTMEDFLASLLNADE